MNEAAKLLAQETAKLTDDLLRKALNRSFINTDWQPNDLKGRVMIKQYPDGIEILCLDDKELLELHPIQIDVTDGLRINRKYRFLD